MLLELNNVTKGYGSRGSHAYREVLSGIDWQLEAGARVAVTGRSGSGKTTLLNLIGTLDKPDAGTLLFNSRELGKMGGEELARFRNRELGFVFQLHHLLPQCTLFENVLLPLLAAKNRVLPGEKEWAEHLLRRTGIWEQRFQKPGEMSGGECQRAAVVRALVNKPKLLLADEPTGALDEPNAAALIDLLLDLSSTEGTALVVVSHTPEVAARMERIFHLTNGQLNARP